MNVGWFHCRGFYFLFVRVRRRANLGHGSRAADCYCGFEEEGRRVATKKKKKHTHVRVRERRVVSPFRTKTFALRKKFLVDFSARDTLLAKRIPLKNTGLLSFGSSTSESSHTQQWRMMTQGGGWEGSSRQERGAMSTLTVNLKRMTRLHRGGGGESRPPHQGCGIRQPPLSLS
jgi:hypothetical protein